MKDMIYYLAISIFLLSSCSESKEKRNMESNIIAVNLERRDNISTKELFSDIQLIPLETTPESLIRDITQIKFFEDRYYIHDYRRSQIFVFDREGRFQFALNGKGDGPGQYLNLSDFAIDTARRNLVVLCAVSNALFFYDLGGRFIEKKRLPDITGAYNSFQFQNKDKIALFTYDYDNRLKFYSLSKDKIIGEYFPEEKKDIFCRAIFPFPHALCRSLTNTIYSLSRATLTELYRWDFGDLNNDIEKLEFPSGRNQQEKIQYAKDAYSSKSVNYVIESHGQNSRYRYAMVVRKNKYIQLFFDRKKQDLLQFERTKEGLLLYPIYFGEDFILCTPEGGLPLDDIFPEKLRNEEQRRIIQSHSEEDNPVLIKYVFKNED
ncbi:MULTISPECIES: 6-bladed beta-propeller [Parabacteroides]|uniref:6-bladed beta-propeller n=1 Tax=Parabacteroides TaxID=375288 RepID=UPI00321B5487